MGSLFDDLRYSARGLLARPGFSAVVIVTLALGIGASTAIFSVADATLRRGLPYRDPDRIVAVWETRPREDFRRTELAYPNYLDVRARQRSLSSLAGYYTRSVTVTGPDGAEQLTSGHGTGDFFAVLGVGAELGRTLGPADELPDAPRAVLLTHGYWQRRFGGDRAVVGQTLTIDAVPRTVVGVLPRAFAFAPFQTADVLLPIKAEGSMATRRNLHWLKVVGRLVPDATVASAQADLGAIAGALSLEHPDSNLGGGLSVVPLADDLLGKIRPILWVLLGAVGLVLLVACANVANLVLARQASRRHELAIRAAMGASRARLVGLLAIDSVLHALLAGVLGVGVAAWVVDLLLGVIPRDILATMPYLAGARLDGAALGFALVVALLSGLAVGVLPALRAATPDLGDRLREDGRGTPGRARTRLRDALVVAEVALAFVLLAAAGLVTRSLSHVLEVNPGFDPRGVTAASLVVPDALARTDEQALVTHDDLLRRVAALPGVEGVASINMLPVGDGGRTIRFIPEGHPPASGELEPEANIRTISAGYFTVMRVPLLAGRAFDAAERPNTVIVNQALARKIFDGDALGKRIVFTFAKDQPAREIVGVVGDEHLGPLDESPRPVVYLSVREDVGQYFSVVVRGGPPGDVLARALGEVSDAMPVFSVTTMRERIDRQPWMFVRRMPAILVGAFALLALALATIGIYGVMSYSVRQRTHEIGIRRAIGALDRHVAGMLVGHAALLAAAGVAIGLGVALVTTRLLGSLLFGVSPWDPATLVASGLLLLGVTVAASWLPARGALAIDPMEALR